MPLHHLYIDPANVFVISLSDNVFEIKMKYHNFIIILLILTYILSYQDGMIVQSLFLLLFAKVVGWFWILICYVLYIQHYIPPMNQT